MKKDNIIIGAIAVIGVLTLFNTYSIFNKKGGRTIAPANPSAQVSPAPGQTNPSVLPQNNPAQFNADGLNQPQPLQQGQPDIPKTSINFAESKKDFGKVLSTSANKHTFVFTNTGTEPLIISNAKGSCGCTVPKWPKEPIAPGETGNIDVEYKPAGQSGVQTKNVTITANTDPATTVLTITGDIQADPNAAKPQATESSMQPIAN